MTDKLISADAFENNLDEIIRGFRDGQKEHGEDDSVADLVRVICHLAALFAPAVDAEPVRHGRWLVDDGCSYCSVCRNNFKKAIMNHAKYCPMCGAKMDEEEKDCERCLQVTEKPGNDICKACGGRRGQDATRVEESDLRDMRE